MMITYQLDILKYSANCSAPIYESMLNVEPEEIYQYFKKHHHLLLKQEGDITKLIHLNCLVDFDLFFDDGEKLNGGYLPPNKQSTTLTLKDDFYSIIDNCDVWINATKEYYKRQTGKNVIDIIAKVKFSFWYENTKKYLQTITNE